MPAQNARLVLPYDLARPHILDADVLLYHGYGIISKLIRTAGRSHYSHAAMAGWANGAGQYPRLMCYEVREFAGGRISNLSWQAKKYPGCIDVYRVADHHVESTWDNMHRRQVSVNRFLDRKQAVDGMREFANPGEYGWTNVAWTSLLHLPVLRLLFPQPMDDKLQRDRPPYCSQAVAHVLQVAFTDVVRNTPTCFTQPGDLDKSPLLHYMFTLGAPSPA